MSNPPSRGSGQGIKTYGKHEVPLVSVEVDEKENVVSRSGGEEQPKVLINKQLARPAGLIHSR